MNETFAYKMASFASLEEDCRELQDKEFIAHLFELALPQQRAYNAVMERHSGNPVGVEYRHKNKSTSWAFVLPDASEPGRHRVQYFDEHGFFSHHAEDTLEDAVQEMVRNGYVTEEKGVLSRVSKTEVWRRGMERCFLMMQVGQGKITYAEYLAKAA